VTGSYEIDVQVTSESQVKMQSVYDRGIVELDDPGVVVFVLTTVLWLLVIRLRRVGAEPQRIW
jgi:hypothetical protein